MTRLLLWVAVSVVVFVALAIQYKIRLSNEWQQRVPLPSAPIHKRGDHVIVFAPHSDDETLGCGGMLATSAANGANVRVVLVTNGDGFRIAVGRAYKTLRVTPQRCVEFACKRQRETVRALATLGVKRGDVVFLGYPDRGIEKLWSKYWDSNNLYTSRATRSDHSPYSNSFTPHAAYCGESLLLDIQKIIRTEKPTDVYIPHPCDNHPDHYATYCFVAAAIEQLRFEGDAQGIKVHTYLVHRGDWPTPRGYHPTKPLSPPYGLARASTKWFSLALPPDIADSKRRAIAQYKTQTAVEKSYLMSFARGNESFVVGMLGAANSIGRFFWGGISDRIGRFTALAAMCGITAIVMLLLPHVALNKPGLIISYLLIGLCYGGVLGTFPSMCADAFGSKDVAINYALLFIAFSIAGIMGPRIGAVLLERTDAYNTAFALAAGIAAAGLALSLGLKFKRA